MFGIINIYSKSGNEIRQKLSNFYHHTINRYSREYQHLLDQAYEALCQNAEFTDALRRSKGRILIHTIGKLRRRDTVLTSIEFCRILTRKRRELLQKGNK